MEQKIIESFDKPLQFQGIQILEYLIRGSKVLEKSRQKVVSIDLGSSIVQAELYLKCYESHDMIILLLTQETMCYVSDKVHMIVLLGWSRIVAIILKTFKSLSNIIL